MRTPVIAGNWKMHKTVDEAIRFVAALRETELPGNVETVICAPFLALPALVGEVQGTRIGVGAQNVHEKNEGAYTGEISVPMLRAAGVKYVIIGHSERRTYFAETDETVNQKVKAALGGGLVPIVCVGEVLEERESGKTKEVVQHQVKQGLNGLSPEAVAGVIIAYEPVWAIGTGKASTAEDAEEVISFIRKTVADLFGQQAAGQVRIQYGGSVKPENISTYIAQPNIDGALVGGASLQPESFSKLVQAAAAGDAS
ncbi:triose-phosphate isomerase [Paenactinomyces guangxiensis]|uniref:Triosephosphate isomerase n=1 Tax=Paenactinomyces guangxiensis TaxID=1490290 RepID=A0A7W2AAS4_9BACL|nr:triose-phosphate isomerase [Paenactinomyces guangxiensis]MBA4496188.1 triose-phosphate isomerase [Paenactinomyces guangxiensis]MBH8593277.1 triose-phosphate isomerase [Paenactinomyces guangxiensis]